jgi:hypothetical protein
MSVTVAQLGARALRKLGIAIVADSARPASGPVTNAAAIAARVLLELGIPVPEANRPAGVGIVAQADLAARALRAVGINPAFPDSSTSTGIIYAAADLATAALEKLSVIASDETPSVTDQALALARINGVHDILAGSDYVTWPVSAVPGNVAEFYIVMAGQLLAPSFGKPANMEAFQQAQAFVRQQSLSGAFGQALALAKVAEVHEQLNGLGMVAWTIDTVPTQNASDYITLTASLLAPIYGFQQDAPGQAADKIATDAAMASLRKSQVIEGAGARAADRVAAVQNELNALGLVTWDDNTIPASLADPIASMALLQMGPEFGREFDPKAWAFNEDRVRRVAMGGPAGQALAEQKVRAVQYSLEARGRARWGIYDIPVWAEEDLVLMAATLLAPECGVKADPAWYAAGEMDLMRIVSLPSNREPVQATYF